MSLEAKILAALCQSRDAYTQVRPYMAADELTPLAEFWYGLIEEWYSADDATGIDKDILRERGDPDETRPPCCG